MGNNEVLQTAEAMNELENYINDLRRFLPFPVISINPSGIITDINQATVDLFGYPEEELIGKYIADFFVEMEKMKQYDAVTREQGGIKNKELLVKLKAGGTVPVMVNAQKREDDQGQMIGYFASFADISEQRKQEAAIREKVEELEQFHKLAVGRELMMIEREKEINALLKELGRSPRYK
ncbi:MAG: PAS domain-containing protein [Candidatus Margulisbacteria bacterium]|nr:PAS domain-containing protein [Candidatus Margulisiibacteriota bacterium]